MAEPGGVERVERVVLVGSMCAGKSAVGRIVAGRLGWAFVDLDRLIEEREGRTVREIFADDGEVAFRRAEAEASEAVAPWSRMVLAPGGGWAAHAGRDARADPATLWVWLRVSPEEVVRRGVAEPGTRPLLAGADPVGDARRLLAEREPHYARADVVVDTEGRTPHDVAAEVEHAVCSRGGAAPR
jgi:shikimate kinase